MEQGFIEYEISLGDRKPEDVFLLICKNQFLIREMRKREESLKTIFKSITGN